MDDHSLQRVFQAGDITDEQRAVNEIEIFEIVKNKTFAACSFSVQGPIWGNRLPASLRNHETLENL